MRWFSPYSSRHFISYFIYSSYCLSLWLRCLCCCSYPGVFYSALRVCSCLCYFWASFRSIDSMYAIYSA